MDAATVLARIDAENLSVCRRTGISPKIKPWVVSDNKHTGYGWTLVEAFEDLLFVRESAT